MKIGGPAFQNPEAAEKMLSWRPALSRLEQESESRKCRCTLKTIKDRTTGYDYFCIDDIVIDSG